MMTKSQNTATAQSHLLKPLLRDIVQLSDFMGYNENAVLWQIWTALLTYALLRFIAWQNEWKHTFTRLFTALRGVAWCHLGIGECSEML